MPNPAPGFEKYPDHEVRISPETQRLVIALNGTEIARSARALRVDESRHSHVWYLPLEDVNQALLTTSGTDTYCPFKGHASYWHIETGDERIEDAVWTYADPYDECEPLRGYVAFYADKVDISMV